MRIVFHESIAMLYGNTPESCPPIPDRDLNMALFQVHISRAQALIQIASVVWKQYSFIVSWESPFLTSMTCFTFVTFCVRFDAEYWGRSVSCTGMGVLRRFVVVIGIVSPSQHRFSLPSLGLLFLLLHCSLSRRRLGGVGRFLVSDHGEDPTVSKGVNRSWYPDSSHQY